MSKAYMQIIAHRLKKLSKRLKVISLIMVAIVGGVMIACANFGSNKPSGIQVTKQSTAKWKAQSPSLFANAGYSKLIESNTWLNKKHSEAQDELSGKVSNPFGIRDDMLEYILTNIPESNVGAIISAIKMVQLDQQEYFIEDVTELNKVVDKEMAAVDCLSTFLGGGVTGEDFLEGYNKVQRNTPLRKAKEEEIEKKLGGHVLSGNFGFWYTTNDSYESICARYIKE